MRCLLYVGAISFVFAMACGSGASAEVVQAPAAVAATGSAGAEQNRLATQLINLIHPDQLMIESNLKGWEAVARKTAASDPVFSKLEKQYPGVIEAAIASARPSAVEYSHEFVRKAKAAKIRIFAESLTASELQQIIDFFQQPAGQRFARSMGGAREEVTDVLAAKGEASENLTEQDLRDVLRKQTKATMSALSADDTIAIMKFESLPVAKKFGAAGQAGDRAILEIINNPDPKWLEAQAKAVADGAVKFVEARQAPRK